MHTFEGVVSSSSHDGYDIFNENYQHFNGILDLYKGLRVKVTIQELFDSQPETKESQDAG